MAWPNGFSTDDGATITAAGIEHPERWSWDGYLQNYAYVQPHTAESLAAWKNFLNDPAMKSGYAEQQRQAEEDKDFDWGNLIDTAIKGAATGMIGMGALGGLSSLFNGVDPSAAMASLEGTGGMWGPASESIASAPTISDLDIATNAPGYNAGDQVAGYTQRPYTSVGSTELPFDPNAYAPPSNPLTTSGATQYVGPELATTAGQPNLWDALPTAEQGGSLTSILAQVPPGTGSLLTSLAGGDGGGSVDMTGFQQPYAPSNPLGLTGADSTLPGGITQPFTGSGFPASGGAFPGYDFGLGYPVGGDMVTNLAGGGLTGAAADPSLIQRLLQAGKPAAEIARTLGISEAAVSAIGKVLGYGLSAVGANQQGNEFRRLSEQFAGYGAPSRARYEASYQPGFSMANDPGYKDALDQTTKSFLHKASIQGNPADSPNAWQQTLKDVNASFAYPALQNYRTLNANTGGFSSFNTAAPGVATQAAGSGGNVWNAVGAGVSDIFNPKRSLAEEFAEYRRLRGG